MVKHMELLQTPKGKPCTPSYTVCCHYWSTLLWKRLLFLTLCCTFAPCSLHLSTCWSSIAWFHWDDLYGDWTHTLPHRVIITGHGCSQMNKGKVYRCSGLVVTSIMYIALIARLSVKKVITSLESCLFTEVLNRGRRALVNSYCYCWYVNHWLATTLMCAVFPQKSVLESILFVATFLIDSERVERLLVQSHLTGLECNAIFSTK